MEITDRYTITIMLQITRQDLEAMTLETNVLSPTPENSTRPIIEQGNICPILQERITNKMTLSCGHSFEQSAILSWLFNHQNNNNDSTCPVCRNIILYDRVRQNANMQQINIQRTAQRLGNGMIQNEITQPIQNLLVTIFFGSCPSNCLLAESCIVSLVNYWNDHAHGDPEETNTNLYFKTFVGLKQSPHLGSQELYIHNPSDETKRTMYDNLRRLNMYLHTRGPWGCPQQRAVIDMFCNNLIKKIKKFKEILDIFP